MPSQTSKPPRIRPTSVTLSPQTTHEPVQPLRTQVRPYSGDTFFTNDNHNNLTSNSNTNSSTTNTTDRRSAAISEISAPSLYSTLYPSTKPDSQGLIPVRTLWTALVRAYLPPVPPNKPPSRTHSSASSSSSSNRSKKLPVRFGNIIFLTGVTHALHPYASSLEIQHMRNVYAAIAHEIAVYNATPNKYAEQLGRVYHPSSSSGSGKYPLLEYLVAYSFLPIPARDPKNPWRFLSPDCRPAPAPTPLPSTTTTTASAGSRGSWIRTEGLHNARLVQFLSEKPVLANIPFANQLLIYGPELYLEGISWFNRCRKPELSLEKWEKLVEEMEEKSGFWGGMKEEIEGLKGDRDRYRDVKGAEEEMEVKLMFRMNDPKWDAISRCIA